MGIREPKSSSSSDKLAEVSSPATPQLKGPGVPYESPNQKMSDAAEMLWVMLANVSGGDWTKQTPEWRDAAARWRDNYFAALKGAASPATPGLELVNKIIDRLTMRTDQMRQQMRDDKAMAKGESKILLRHALEASADLHEGFANAMCCDVEDFEKWRGELASLHQKDE